MTMYQATTYLPTVLTDFLNEFNGQAKIEKIDPLSGKVTLAIEASDLWDLRVRLEEIEAATASVGFGGVGFDRSDVKEMPEPGPAPAMECMEVDPHNTRGDHDGPVAEYVVVGAGRVTNGKLGQAAMRGSHVTLCQAHAVQYGMAVHIL